MPRRKNSRKFQTRLLQDAEIKAISELAAKLCAKLTIIQDGKVYLRQEPA